MDTSKRESLEKSLFNVSLCYKLLKQYDAAYKYQMEFYNLIGKTNEYNRMISLGIISDILIETGSTDQIIQKCIRINLDRLKLLKSIAVTNKQAVEAAVEEEPITKYVLDSLEKISRCYAKLENYDQMLKFKFLQLDLLNEQQVTDFKKAVKLWLDIGNVYMTKLNKFEDAVLYFEMVLKVASEKGDSLIESLALGNLGLCKQKKLDYDGSIGLFTKQSELLVRKLDESNEESLLIQPYDVEAKSNRDTSNNLMVKLKIEATYLTFSSNLMEKIKEIVSIRIDLGRSFAKMAKSYELMFAGDRKSVEHYDQAIRFYTKYCLQCKYLYEVYIKSYFFNIEILKGKYSKVKICFFL
jgi:tetratricopeptide (TPR) repeat protein